ncbi:MAG: copper-translocating P-type ATPase [Candidatus Andersenbacteria bacterium RIFCSPHIGHO2_12_FULL_45_11b]|uniref:Copper-translocating P-type ATPase n=1 Tax=Candidatus Andersenbacteria bacterium RIFCSPHIGHO2_12_FULL_45_11b TaxID=1797282 RepID=A0A1G1XBZ9_9BACT|nr:MAG: copper-translocating P-type ATPase [Candidatus Andersenbacteria bacterium RIFCSPHIGHO2_12_FULL_45_11b]
MHPEVISDKPGSCPKCGMNLVPQVHNQKEMTKWEKFKMSMTMAMGMEHSGLAGREMAALMERDIRNKFWFAFIITIGIILYSPMGEMLPGMQLPSPIPIPWLLFILTTPVFFYSGWIFLYSTYKALQKKIVNMAVLIAVGITAAYGFSIVLTVIGSADSYYEAAAMLITFVLFGHWMEMKSRRGTTDALQALMNLVPPQARVIRNEKEILVSTADVRIGEIVVLKPGDKVPVDGVIVEGETAIDESLVTGESIPVAKKIGDEVIGASINQSGSVQFKATKVGADTALAQIVKLVEIAQNSKAPGQKLADRFAKYLVFVAVGGGLLTFIIWYFVMGESLLFALTFAISTIVIACPDALGLATPTAVAVGTSLGAKHNILIKDAPTLEQVSKIQAVILDKTGTLTEGKPKVTDVAAFNGFTEADVLRYEASVEVKSSHPLAKAILEEVERRQTLDIPTIEKFESIAGHGVKAIAQGKTILAGKEKLLLDNSVSTDSARDVLDTLASEGKTLSLVSVDGVLAGVIGAADTIKPTAARAIAALKELHIEIAMITGDHQKVAEAVGRELGIERIFAGVLPADKAKYVKKLQDEGKFVAMVGDGVNDAPALAQADIGIAIGAGTDVAIETAKIVLMRSDPADIIRAIRLSKATVLKMKQNLFWASIYNLLAIPVAAGVLYPSFGISLRPEIAALLMSISSIIVATNAVLLKRAEKSLITV